MRVPRRRSVALVVSTGLVGVAACALLAWQHVRAGRALLDGRLHVDGLADTVVIERDASGVPTIRGRDRPAVTYGMGFVHAQDRFFQMDVARRVSAGRLSELFGRRTRDFDRRFRAHALERTARAAVAAMAADERALLAAYAAGVNAGLAALAAPPFEYAVLAAGPVPWDEHDTLLVALNLYLLLQLNQEDQEYHLDTLYRSVPAAVAAFLAPPGTTWDAPLDATRASAARVPPPSVFSLRDREAVAPLAGRPVPPRGSNGWAVGGRLTGGAAIVANDMHLSFSVPNALYRLTLAYDAGGETQVTGVTIPGFPVIAAGSNGDVAWGLTNSGADTLDLIHLEQEGLPPAAFHGPHGVERITRRPERIDGEDVEIEDTSWGPVVRTDPRGRRFAARWIAHLPAAVNLALHRLETCTTAHAALAIAQRAGVPAMNFIAGDRDGAIGWTIAGPLPRRSGPPPTRPLGSRAAEPWSALLAPADVPVVENPPSGIVWSANARPLGAPAIDRLGYGYYVLGARAAQIRDGLLALRRFDVAAMSAVQDDDRGLFLAPWKRLLERTLAHPAARDVPARAELVRVLATAGARAHPDSASHRLVRAFRERVDAAVFGPVVAHVRERDPAFDLNAIGDQREGPLWALATTRPAWWLPRGQASWSTLLAECAAEVARAALRDSGSIAAHRWGDQNRLIMQHLFGAAVPGVGWWLDMPRVPLRGDLNMPLSQYRNHGPVMRMAVSPGSEREGRLALPGGPSGNPTSPYYASTHDAWLHGQSAFLPGRAVHRLTLVGSPPPATAGRALEEAIGAPPT